MTAKGTRYSVRDKDGNILCHSPNQIKRNADSARKRAVRSAFWQMCQEAGIVRGNLVMDVVTGAYLPMADADTANDDFGKVDRGHVIADSNDGAFCPCNLVPENRGANKSHAHKDANADTWLGEDPRTAWRSVWLANYATKSKARRAA